MLRELNRFTERHGFAVGVILFVVLVGPLIFVFGQGGCSNMRGDLFRGESMGTLKGQPVSYDEFKHHVYAFVLESVLYSGEYRDLNSVFRGQSEADFFRPVISRMRYLKFAEDSGWGHVSQKRLADFKKGLPAFQEDGKFSPKKYRMFRDIYLKKQPVTLAEFNQICIENIVIQRVEDHLSSATVSKAALRADILTSEGDLEYAFKTFDKKDYEGEKVSDTAIKEYYENFKDSKLKLPERKRAKLAVFSTEVRPPGAKPVTEEDIKAEFEKRYPSFEVKASHILVSYKGANRADKSVKRTKEEAEKRAKELAKKAKAKDADFAALAKEESDGPSKDKGGDLGFFSRKGGMVEPFAKASYELKVDEVSDPVESIFGYHVIKVTATRPIEIKESLDEFRSRIRGELVRERDKELWEKLAKKTYDRNKKKDYRKEQATLSFIRIAKNSEDKNEKALDRDRVNTIYKDAVLSKDLAKFFTKELKEKSKTMGTFQRVTGFMDVKNNKSKDKYIQEGLKLKKGEIGPLVEDERSYYIVQKLEVRNEQPFDEVKMGLRFKEESKVRQKLTKEITEKIKSITDAVKVEPNKAPPTVATFVKAAQKTNATLVDTPYLNAQSDQLLADIAGGVKAQTVYGKLKWLTKEKPCSMTMVFGKYRAVAILTDLKPAKVPTLEEAKPEIVKTLKEANTLKAARDKAKELKDSLLAQLEKGVKPKELDEFEDGIDYSDVRDQSRIPEQYASAGRLSQSTPIQSVAYADMESGGILVYVKGRERREKSALADSFDGRLNRVTGTDGDRALDLSAMLESTYEFIPDPRYTDLLQPGAAK